MSFFKRANGVGDLAQVRYVKAGARPVRKGCGHALDRHDPVRLRRSLQGSPHARLEPARIQGRGFQARSRSPERSDFPATGARGNERIRMKGADTMRIAVIVAGVLLALPAMAETQPDPGLLDARIRTAPYSHDQVYRLVGFVGYQTDLEFESGESFVGLGAGDIEGLSFVAADNHLFLKPKAAKIGTNLTILTNRRTYQVDYSASAERPDACPGGHVRAALQVSAGADRGRGRSSRARSGLNETKNIDYWFCGDPPLKPIAALDDGVHTRITFGPERPITGDLRSQ